ncbi:MAG: tRNA uridine-5-carboxymethylaminomethyl(34) synthesis GTPase MnmE, partial [Muribaculaceae bacterium]|nr:tRNA uridine-5-carboxymethylaminomethyl(34) synthesis GTPase MnmE [Muribaculaceae bacterium]
MKSIAAISTPPGIGGIAVIRLSGDDAFLIADKIWKGTPLSQLPSHTARLGIITDSDGEMLDQAVATIYAEGKSFTGEP